MFIQSSQLRYGGSSPRSVCRVPDGRRIVGFAFRRASGASRLRRECDPGKVHRSEKADLVW
jgi:hypothetical protein